MERIKRILSLVLVLAMVLAYVPTTVFAADGDYTVAGTFNNWNTTATSMTDNKNGTHTTTLSLAVGYYEFKVTDGTWNNSWGGSGPGGNYALTVLRDCDVTFKFLVNGEKASVSTNEKVTIYFINTANWTNVYAYTWSDSAEWLGGWPGKEMTKVSDQIWSIQIPAADFSNFIFHNGSGDQTGNLSIPTNGSLFYNYETGTWTTCPHYSHDTSGTCAVCAASVGHSYDSTGLCSCGDACPHDNYTNGTCDECGMAEPKTAVASVTTADGVTTEYSSLYDAITAANASKGNTVKLLDNAVLGGYSTINIEMTLDLNGKTLSPSDGASYTVIVGDYGNLTIDDTSTEKNGSIQSGITACVLVYAGKLTLNNGNVNGTIEGFGGTGYETKAIIINGGVINSAVHAVHAGSSPVTVNGGTISTDSSYPVIFAKSLTVTDGTIDASFDASCETIQISGGTFIDGIKVARTTLEASLVADYVYFQSGEVVTLSEDQTEIAGGDVTVGSHSHNWQTDGTCTDCGEECSHSGGTATCKTQAVCDTCGASYGELAAHSYDNGFCTVCDAYEPAVDSDNDSYYEIDNAGKLYWFATKAGREANAKLTANIVVNTGDLTNYDGSSENTWREWEAIGNYNYSYKGTFDGQGYTISGLYHKANPSKEEKYFGLFGCSTGTVQNLGIVNTYFDHWTYFGGIVGYNYGMIQNCFFSGRIEGYERVGGITGYNHGTVINCYNNGTVKGSLYVGGIAGCSYKTLENCYNTGSVSAVLYNCGSIVGSGTAVNCYYLENTATDKTAVQNGIGSATSGSTTADVEGSTTVKSNSQFASGEVTWLLNNKTAEGSLAWGQNIDGEGTKDAYPVLGGPAVYFNTDSYSNTKPAVHEHSMTHHEKVDATCTKDGTVEYWSCSGCGKNFSDEEGTTELTDLVIPKGHVLTHVEEKTATCTEDGNVEYWYCSVCKKYFSDEACTTEIDPATIPIDPTGHTYGAEGTCTNINNDVVCGEVAPASVARGTGAPTYYATLQAALDAVKECTAEDAAVVTVRKDITTTDGMAGFAKGGVFTLDIGEFDLTGSNYALQFNKSTVTLTGTTGTVSKIYLLYSDLTVAGGNVTCADAETAIMVNESALAITGGTVGSTENNATAIYATDNASVAISGSAAVIATGSGASALWVDGADVSIAVTGGTIEATTDFKVAENSTINASLSSGTFTDGITVDGTAGEDLNSLLAEGYTYWQNGKQMDVADGVYTLASTVEVKESCKHTSITYTASGAALTSDCDTCDLAAEASLKALTEEERVYTAEEKIVAAAGAILGYDELPEVTYEGDRKNVGTFTAKLAAGNVVAELPQTIIPFVLQVQSFTPETKVYNGDTAGKLKEITFVQGVGSEVLALNTDVTAKVTFPAADAGEYDNVTVTISLANTARAKNYDLVEAGKDSITYTNNAMTIQPATITITGTTVAGKTYDGTTDAAVTLGEITGILNGDDVTVTAIGAFADIGSGENKTVTVTYTASGEDSGNYIFAAATEELTASITPISAEEIMEPVKNLTVENVTSDDLEDLEKVKEKLELQLTDPGLSPEDKETLEGTLEDVQDMLDRVDEALNAPDTDAVEDTMDITNENVKPEDRENIEQAIKDLEDVLEDYGDNYTEEEKKIIQDNIDRLEDALETLEKVESVTDLISKLPDTVEPDDEDTAADIEAAKDAYDDLSDYEMTFISQADKEKLDKLVTALVNYKIIKGDGSTWTKGTASGLGFTANGAYSKFTGIEVDGKALNKASYTAKSGSTVIEMTAAFLENLTVGKHTITVCYTDGKAEGSFTIQAEPVPETTVPGTAVPETTVPETTAPDSVSPPTGDDSNIFHWSIMFLLCAAAAAALIGGKKRFDEES